MMPTCDTNRWRARAAVLTIALVASAARPAPGQEPPVEALRVFLDCDPCDFDHFRREVPFVNYVRDRRDAALHVLVTAQGTGGGGREYTFHFLGLGAQAGRSDTLRYVSRQTDTDAEVRDGLVHRFTLGLVRYLATTPLAERVQVLFRGAAAPQAAPADDPWNLWLFRVGLSAEANGEERTSATGVSGSLEASRVTEAWKIDLEASGRYSDSRFELSADTTLVSTSRDLELEGLVVGSLGPHWSAGVRGSARRSTRVNQDFALRLAPALEYSLYPYAESTRRQITFLYTVGLAAFDYEEITIFDRLTETRFQQSFEILADFEQPWGSIIASFELSSFLHDVERHRADLFAGLEIRLFRGLNLDLRGSVARIKDQLFLPREDIPEEDILLRRRQLGTDFEYFIDVGFSFIFGSIFNNVVNPRLGDG